MRKNFLLLFLMALLPLAGWAEQSIADYTFTIQTASIEYSGAAVDVQPTLTNPNVVTPLTLDTDYVLEFYQNGTKLDAAPVNRGDYTVKAKGIGGYQDYNSTEIAFTITKKSLADATIGDLVYTECRTGSPSPTSATYDGEAWEPTATFTLTSFTLVKGTDYTVSYEDNTNAGTAKIIFTATENGNFTGSKSQNFTIAKAAIPSSAYTAPVVKTGLKYTGVAQDLLTAGTVTDNKYGTIQYQVGTADYSATVPTGKNAATYNLKWKIVGGANYNDKAEASLTDVVIGKCATGVTIRPVYKEKAYDGTALSVEGAQFSISGLVGDDATAEVTGLSASIASPAATVGDYTVSVAGTPTIGTTALSTSLDVASILWNIASSSLNVSLSLRSSPSLSRDPMTYSRMVRSRSVSSSSPTCLSNLS